MQKPIWCSVFIATVFFGGGVLAQQSTYDQRSAEIDLRYSQHLALFSSHCDNLMNPKCPEWYNIQIAIIAERDELDDWFRSQGGRVTDIKITEFPAETVAENIEAEGQINIPTANHCVQIINNRVAGDFVRIKNVCDEPIVIHSCYTVGTTENLVSARCAERGEVGDTDFGNEAGGFGSGTIRPGVTRRGPEIFEGIHHELVVMACERHPEHGPGVATSLYYSDFGRSFKCLG